jgi:hypothetical protein
MQNKLKSTLPHLLAAIIFVIVAGLYTSPVFEGKTLIQHDAVQGKGGGQEARTFHEKTGIWSGWTNSMFGGMPTYMIAMGYPNSISTKMGQVLNKLLPSPTNVIVLQMLSMYLLLLVLGCSSWLSIIGGITYGFGCYTLIFLEAGHISKINATAFAPLVLAGVVLIMRAKYWLGAALLAVGMGLELYANHVQITYFLAFSVVIYVIWEALSLLKQGKINQLLKAFGFMAIAALIGGLTQTTRLWSAKEYADESTRGRSELTISADSTETKTAGETGMKRDDAFYYTHGVAESFTLLIPNFKGGASQGGLSRNSETYKALTDAGVEATQAEEFAKKQAPVYWGPQSFTVGAGYAGAIIVFLFILGLFIIKSDIRWYLLVICTLYLSIAWGRNFATFNYFMFDYFPLFNKFRDNKMVLVLMEMFLAMGAILALKTILEEKPTFAIIKKPLFISLALTAGLALIFGFAGSLFFDFTSTSDANLEQMIGNADLAKSLQIALKNDRASLLRADGLRSAGFILLAALAIFLFLKNKLKQNIAIGLIGLLILIDLFGVNKRVFNNDDYVSKSAAEEVFVASPADELILKDTSLNYRVADFTTRLWNDAKPSYFHKSIGGYHGAVLKRTQELYDFQISRNNMEVLNMMNVKYFEIADSTGNAQVQLNSNAHGNAWFVRNYKIVANANEEIKALDRFDAKQTAFIDKRFESQLKNLNIDFDSTNYIKLTAYEPNHLSYISNSKTTQLSLFSEIFYRGNIDWQASIDGKPVDHLRADYVLRGLIVPAGNHKIDFVFDPPTMKKGNTIDLIASILMVLLVVIAFWFERKKG